MKKTIQFLGMMIILSSFLSSCENRTFDQMADEMTEQVPFQKSWLVSTNTHILDCRTIEEFNVSHLRNAIWVGDLDAEKLPFSTEDSILVYCSVGYRSAKYTQELRALGFKNAVNLWGGIFNVVNQNGEVLNEEGVTLSIHPYNKRWGRWLIKGVQVYE